MTSVKPNFLSQTKVLEADQFLLNIDLNRVIGTSSLPTSIQMLALELQVNNYITTGNYFAKLSNSDLEELFKMAELIETKDFNQYFITNDKAQKALTSLILFGMLLCIGEGESEMTKTEMKEMVQALSSIILTETLARTRGSVKLLRNNYSLIETNRLIGIPLKR